MKIVGDNVYVHITAISELPEKLQRKVENARIFFREMEGNRRFQLVKVSKTLDRVSFLCYPDFWHEDFPELTESWTISDARSPITRKGLAKIKHRTYSADNPPILHRKELFVKQNDRRHELLISRAKRVTAICEGAGCFKHTTRIGRKKFWEDLLLQKGVLL
jgi:hypothetical protein